MNSSGITYVSNGRLLSGAYVVPLDLSLLVAVTLVHTALPPRDIEPNVCEPDHCIVASNDN